ncbi:MAG: hypothetical protein IJT12_04980, partial [Paludibacteraceae bacterium]|nr:hypothetical protein [Paludibacteraceae bacterium]
DKAAVSRGLLRAYAKRGDAEYSTAVARCRTAKQFAMFMQPERVEQFPNLKWLRSTSVNPRAEHTKFYDHVWRKDDLFWSQNSPGTEWNCKCDIEETDEPVWDNSGLKLPEPVPGLEGNAAKTGEVFTDNAGYIKDADGSWEREKECRLLDKKQTQQMMLSDSRTHTISVNGEEGELICTPKSAKHAANEMYTEGGMDYWLKNTLLPNLHNYIHDSNCLGRKVSDVGHNTNKETLKIKANSDRFYYYSVPLPNGKTCCVHLGHYRNSYQESSKAGKYYIYSVTSYVPKNIESL